jgi:uncharacterized metal-binding protein YceD (DUF177 family)
MKMNNIHPSTRHRPYVNTNRSHDVVDECISDRHSVGSVDEDAAIGSVNAQVVTLQLVVKQGLVYRRLHCTTEEQYLP